MKQFDVTDLDFEDIKDNLRGFLESQDRYKDWNFEGSNLSTILDVLAYNTHYNAVQAHLAMNETFLDSAQIRGNVTGHANLLGYLPRPTIGAVAAVTIVVGAPTDRVPDPYLTLERGTKFSTTIDSEQYPFVVTDSQTVPLVTNQEIAPGFILPAGYVFPVVLLKQGVMKRMQYRFDNNIPQQRFEIPEETVDLTTLRVRVREHDEASTFDTYRPFLDGGLSTIREQTKVYFAQENTREKYEIYFGNGVIGFKPDNNNILDLEYVYSKGPDGNGASEFKILDSIGGLTNITIITQQQSIAGADRESIESIKFNAPLTYITQDRAVTADDYAYIITKEFGQVEAISAWGGEVASPPDFGKVFIAIKPFGAPALTPLEKEDVVNKIKKKNVVSITPVIVDPKYTYIALEVDFKYDANQTDKVKEELEADVMNTIMTYNDNELKRFDGVFRSSNLLCDIDETDSAILNSTIRVYMFNDIVTRDNLQENFHEISFGSPIHISDSSKSTISSTPFKVNGIDHYFADKPIPNSTKRRVFTYKIVNNEQQLVLPDAGEVDTTTGNITLRSYRTDDSQTIRITALPHSNDLAPIRQQLLEIDPLEVKIDGQVDTIAVGGSVGSTIYTTSPRVK